MVNRGYKTKSHAAIIA